MIRIQLISRHADFCFAGLVRNDLESQGEELRRITLTGITRHETDGNAFVGLARNHNAVEEFGIDVADIRIGILVFVDHLEF